MFLRHDWAFFVAGSSLMAIAVWGFFSGKSESWIFLLVGFALSSLPMVQRLEIKKNSTDGLSIGFERPKVNEIVKLMSHSAKLRSGEDREALKKATAELKAVKNTQRREGLKLIGALILLTGLAVFFLSFSSNSNDKNESGAASHKEAPSVEKVIDVNPNSTEGEKKEIN